MSENICPIGVNHDVEWPCYRHVHHDVDADCIILVPHWIIEAAWSALNTVVGSYDADGESFLTKEQFALLDEAHANLDAFKHGELADCVYDVVDKA